MSTVVVSITTKKQTLPASPAASSNMRYQLLQGGVVKFSTTVGLPTLQATFTSVPDGDYTVVVQRMSMQNQPLGDSMSADFSVAATAQVDVPDTVVVELT